MKKTILLFAVCLSSLSSLCQSNELDKSLLDEMSLIDEADYRAINVDPILFTSKNKASAQQVQVMNQIASKYGATLVNDANSGQKIQTKGLYELKLGTRVLFHYLLEGFPGLDKKMKLNPDLIKQDILDFATTSERSDKLLINRECQSVCGIFDIMMSRRNVSFKACTNKTSERCLLPIHISLAEFWQMWKSSRMKVKNLDDGLRLICQNYDSSLGDSYKAQNERTVLRELAEKKKDSNIVKKVSQLALQKQQQQQVENELQKRIAEKKEQAQKLKEKQDANYNKMLAIQVASHPEWKTCESDLSFYYIDFRYDNWVDNVKHLFVPDGLKYSKELQDSAMAGNVESLENLGFCYLYGLGVERNSSTAAQIFYDAVKRGAFEGWMMCEAHHALDEYYKDQYKEVPNIAIERKYAPAIFFWSLKNDPDRSSVFLPHPRPVNVKDAKLLETAAELGYPAAYCLLAEYLKADDQLTEEQYINLLMRCSKIYPRAAVFAATYLYDNNQKEKAYECVKNILFNDAYKSAFIAYVNKDDDPSYFRVYFPLRDQFCSRNITPKLLEESILRKKLLEYIDEGLGNPYVYYQTLLQDKSIESFPNKELYLAIKYIELSKESSFIEKEKAKNIVLDYAKKGNTMAMCMVQIYDIDKSKDWIKAAAEKGCWPALYRLALKNGIHGAIDFKCLNLAIQNGAVLTNEKRKELEQQNKRIRAQQEHDANVTKAENAFIAKYGQAIFNLLSNHKLRAGMTINSILEYNKIYNSVLDSYILKLDIDHGSSKCYQVMTLFSNSYIWTSNGVITTVIN